MGKGKDADKKQHRIQHIHQPAQLQQQFTRERKIEKHDDKPYGKGQPGKSPELHELLLIANIQIKIKTGNDDREEEKNQKYTWKNCQYPHLLLPSCRAGDQDAPAYPLYYRARIW